MSAVAARRRSLITALVAMALALACLIVTGAMPARGATVTGPVEGLDVTAIDAGRTVDLTLRLTPTNPYDEVPPGHLPPGGVAGTTFTVRRLAEVDLATRAGWARATSMTVAEANEGPFAHTDSGTTGAEGTVTFAGLPVGLYMVTARMPDDPTVEYPRVDPFLLTLPTGSPGGWNYQVQVNVKKHRHASETTTRRPPPTPWLPPWVPVSPPPVTGNPMPTPTPTTVTTVTTPEVPPGDTPGDGESTPRQGELAKTGASVLALLGASLVLVGLGLLFRRVASAKRR